MMRLPILSGLLVTLSLGCAGGPTDAPVEREQPFTSQVATLMDFEFDGELLTTVPGNLKTPINSQLMYTVGHFNAEPGVARLDRLVLSNLSSTLSGGLYRIRYHAKLPVAWGHKTNLPSSYTLRLPRRVDLTGQNAFTTRYAGSCNDGEGADVSVSNFWYHYRPGAAACSPTSADIVTIQATAKVSTQNRVLTFPEYHKVWEDNALRVVAVFGKYTAGARAHDDPGIQTYDNFVKAVREELPGATVSPAGVPEEPGAEVPEVRFVLETPGRTISVVAILIDSVTSAGASFDKRYAELTPGADLVVYNGHAGLGANIRSLATKGKFFPAQYQIFFFDGCDTFAYGDDALIKTRAVLNPSDPEGTRYMDTITNAMPAYFVSMPGATMALIRALEDPSAPRAYQEIFADVDASQVVVVTGEEDNVFNRSYDPGIDWDGFHAGGEVGYKETVQYQTDVLPAGKYAFTMTPDPATPGGDGDLRVRVGAVPTLTATYKCPSYVANSNEKCTVTVTTPSRIYLNATGDSTQRARFNIAGYQLAN